MPNTASLIDALGNLYSQYGYMLVFLGALAENTAVLGLVLPGGTLALLGAFYARQGTLNLGWVIALAWAGTVLGYHVDYLLGRFVLSGTLDRWGRTRFGRRMRLPGRMRQARKLLNRHGGKAILISHTVGHVRSFVALSAGATHMRYRRFLAFELVAALLWNIAYGLLGYAIGTQYEQLQILIERSGWVLLGSVIALFLGWRYAWPHVPGWWKAARRWLVANSFTPPWLVARGWHPALIYLPAALLLVAAAGMDWLLVQTFPLLVFLGLLELLAVALIALGWGAGPSLLATLIGAVLLNFVVLPAHPNWAPDARGNLVETAIFIFIAAGGVISIAASRVARARREAHLANQHMEMLLSIISHELRQPLTVLKGGLQLVERRLASLNLVSPTDNERVRQAHDWLARADHETNVLDRLIGDLLDAARLRSETLMLSPAQHDLADIVRTSVERQELVWPARTLTLILPPAGTLPVMADAPRIEQVITNYLTNALKYAPETRPIVVTARRARGGAQVAVRDEGQGLPLAERQRVWERFHRVQGIEAQSGGGGVSLGLGLHISKVIVERHGGHVGVDSAPGEGATFWFTLPLAETSTPAERLPVGAGTQQT